MGNAMNRFFHFLFFSIFVSSFYFSLLQLPIYSTWFMCAILTKQITHILQLQARKKKRNKSAKDKKNSFPFYWKLKNSSRRKQCEQALKWKNFEDETIFFYTFHFKNISYASYLYKYKIRTFYKHFCYYFITRC